MKEPTAMLSVDEQLAIVMRGVVECHTEAELKRKLERAVAKRQPLRVKLGIDPSSPDIHVGHSVVLRKLRQFQDLGHKAVLIIGTGTAQVGDPSGQNKTRPQLTAKDVEGFAQTYLDQVGFILDQSDDKLEIVKNGDWFEPMHFADFMRLLSRLTIAQVLARDDFKQRVREEREVRLHELVYPAMQGWDSVMVRADVELGGHDQLFNLLVGRDFQGQEGQEPQVCLMTPLLNGLDGRKMSKSYGNHIGVTFPPEEVFGKTMAIGDEMMRDFFVLLTDVEPSEIDTLVDAKKTHPRDAKRRLAWELTSWLHDAGAADKAQAHFETVFVKHDVPDDLPELELAEADLDNHGAIWIPALITKAGFASTNSEARRLVTGGGVTLDGERVADPTAVVADATRLEEVDVASSEVGVDAEVFDDEPSGGDVLAPDLLVEAKPRAEPSSSPPRQPKQKKTAKRPTAKKSGSQVPPAPGRTASGGSPPFVSRYRTECWLVMPGGAILKVGKRRFVRIRFPGDPYAPSVSGAGNLGNAPPGVPLGFANQDARILGVAPPVLPDTRVKKKKKKKKKKKQISKKNVSARPPAKGRRITD